MFNTIEHDFLISNHNCRLISEIQSNIGNIRQAEEKTKTFIKLKFTIIADNLHDHDELYTKSPPTLIKPHQLSYQTL